jgi:hypothetical protein
MIFIFPNGRYAPFYIKGITSSGDGAKRIFG